MDTRTPRQETERRPQPTTASPLFPSAAPTKRRWADLLPRLRLPDGWRPPTRDDVIVTCILVFFVLVGGVLLTVGAGQLTAGGRRWQNGAVIIIFGVLFGGPALYLLAQMPQYYLRTYTPPRPAEPAPVERYWGPVRLVERRARGERRAFFAVLDGGLALPLPGMTRDEFRRIPAPEGPPRPLPPPERGSEREKRLHAATVEYAPGDGTVRAIFDAQMRPLHRPRPGRTTRR